MSLGLSPSIEYNEKSFLNVVEQVANRFAGMVGRFPWGAVDERVLIENETDLLNQFLAPTEDNYKDWFSAKNYLDYNNKLYVVRSITESGSYNSGLTTFSEELKNISHGTVTGTFVEGETITGGTSSATGTIVVLEDESMNVKVLTGTFAEAETITGGTSSATVTTGTITDIVKTAPFKALKKNFDDDITVNSETYQVVKFLARYCGSYGNDISIAMSSRADFLAPDNSDVHHLKGYITSTMTFKDNFEFEPNAGEIAIAVLLNGEVVEKHIVSLTEGSKNYRGENNYIETYLENYSNYIFAFHNTSYSDVLSFDETPLEGGVSVAPTASSVISSYNLFVNPDEVDVDVIFDGANMELTDGETVIQHIIDNILEKNKLMRGVFGAQYSDLVGVSSDNTKSSNLQTYFSLLARDTTFGAFYGEYKYQKDVYNDKYRWVPISGDMAGLYAVSEAFEAPAGISRGRIKNCIKLAFNPSEAYRDTLNPKGINTIYNIRNTGFVCMSQKTMQTSIQTAFSRVETRGLFILLRKSTVHSSLYYLFEKHTPSLRRRFISDVDPYFRRLKGLDAIEDYLIVCDESNNTSEVRDNNMMIGDFYVKPFNSVEWIKLSFTATQSNVNFEELIVANPTL